MTVSDPLRTHAIHYAVQRFYNRFVRLKGTPRQIALGFSLGLMIGMTPFWGTHLILCLGMASFFGWNKIAAIVGMNITNVFTAPLIYPVNYWVGLKLAGFSRGAYLPSQLDWETLFDLVEKSPQILADLSIGGLVLGLPLAAGGYVFALRAVCLYRRQRKTRQGDPLDGCLKSLDRSQ